MIFISKGEETTFNTLFTKSYGDLRTALIDPRNFYAAPHTYIQPHQQFRAEFWAHGGFAAQFVAWLHYLLGTLRVQLNELKVI